MCLELLRTLPMNLSAAKAAANSAGTAVFAVELESLAASESIIHSRRIGGENVSADGNSELANQLAERGRLSAKLLAAGSHLLATGGRLFRHVRNALNRS